PAVALQHRRQTAVIAPGRRAVLWRRAVERLARARLPVAKPPPTAPCSNALPAGAGPVLCPGLAGAWAGPHAGHRSRAEHDPGHWHATGALSLSGMAAGEWRPALASAAAAPRFARRGNILGRGPGAGA